MGRNGFPISVKSNTGEYLNKREYIAATIAAGLVSNVMLDGKNEQIARAAISLADELLRQLSKEYA